MQNIISNIYLISALCTGVILILLIVRMIAGKRAGAWWRSIIWLVILVRMLIPYTFSSPISIFNNQGIVNIQKNVLQAFLPETVKGADSETLYEIDDATISISDNAASSEDANTNLVAENNTDTVANPPYSSVDNPNYSLTNTGFNWINISYYIYISGFIASLAYLIIRMLSLSIGLKHFEECRNTRVIDLFYAVKFRMNINRKVKILIDKNISVPAIAGVFKPKLILPQKALDTMTDNQLEYVFIHELTHLKRNDVLKLWFLEFVICVHWFNPVLYFIKSIIRQDIELSCDEKIISSLDNKHYIDYCNVLMLTSIKKYKPIPGVITANMAGKSGKKLKERLTMINKFNKKKALIYGIVMLMVIVTVFISCTTESVKKEDDDYVAIDWEAEPKTVDMVFQGYNTKSASPYNVTYINQMVKVVNERLLKELNCKIDFNWVYYENYTEDLTIMLASDDSPDMIAQYSIPDYYEPLADKNLLVDISDMKYQYMPKLTKRLEKLTPSYFDYQALAGDTYVMPSVGYYPQRNIVAVLKTIQDEYGKEINTLEEYEEFMIWCQTAYPDMTAGYYYDQLLFIETYMQSRGYTQASSSFYMHTASNQTTHYPMEMMDEFYDAYSTMKRWHSSGYLGNLTFKTFPNALKNNKLASMLTVYSNLSNISLSLSEGSELFYHVLNEDQKIPSAPNAHGFVFCKNGDAVKDGMRFLEWVHKKQENNDLIKYGIEGTHYTLEDNKISFPNYYMSDIYQWSGSEYFDDYKYERALVNEPDNYKDIISRITVTNSFSEYDYFDERKKKILTFTQGEKDSIKVFEGKISNTFDKRVEVLYYLFDLWEKGDFSMSSDEVIEILLTEGKGNELYNLYKEIDEFIQEKK